MAPTFPTATKQVMGEAFINKIGNAGKCVLFAAGDVVLATIPLLNPAGTFATDRVTLTTGTTTKDTSADANGVPVKAQIQDSAGAVVMEGTAGPVTVVTGVTTVSGSNVISAGAGSFTAALEGRSVTGTGIPADTFVRGRSGDTLVLSKPATAAGTVSLTFAPDFQTFPQIFLGSEVPLASFTLILPG